VFWIAFLLGAAELPIVLMTGSRIRPGHLLVFGKGPRGPHNDLGNWLSLPTGFLLRTANLIGLLEALLAMALWISARRVDWMDFPALDDLPLIECVIIYFAVGSYLSVKTMRKSSLLRVAILLNLSTFVLIVYLQQLNSADLAFLAVLSWIMICLWAIYVFTRLIALEPVRVTNSVNNGTTRPSTPRVSHQATL